MKSRSGGRQSSLGHLSISPDTNKIGGFVFPVNKTDKLIEPVIIFQSDFRNPLKLSANRVLIIPSKDGIQHLQAHDRAPNWIPTCVEKMRILHIVNNSKNSLRSI